MKYSNSLKGLRVILAILFFIPVFFLFIDFRSLTPDSWHHILHIQLVPALLSGTMIAVAVFQLVLAFLFGRIYCSVICPAGILQDIVNRIYCIGKKKKKGVRRFNYKKPLNWLRYILTALAFIPAIFGITELVVLLDPYSNFGRIATNLFRPAVVWGNNILAELLAKADNYTLFHVSVNTVTAAGLIAGITALLVFIVLAAWRGRLFCNTLCPVGGLLSLVSRYSLFRINIDKQTCIGCGICEHSCKAEAINSKDFTVDASRCVDCFNCLSDCKKGSIRYKFSPSFRKEKAATPEAAALSYVRTDGAANSRRTFLATGVTIAASAPVVSAIAQRRRRHHGEFAHGEGNVAPLTPPGSVSLAHFREKCTGCHVCVVKCPSQVLRPAGLQYGWGYLLRPHLSYENSYCNYECTVCADVCPAHAIKPLTIEEKTTTQVGIAEFFLDRCIVETENTDCGACSEHCPTQAVHMELYKEGTTLTVPVVEPHLCIGCGGCESICPVRPHRAIIVKSNTVHQIVEKPAEEEVLDIKVDDFGF